MEVDFSSNREYRKLLSEIDVPFYQKYIDDISDLKKIAGRKFLDCGCGIGTVLRELDDKENNYGVEVSNFFAREIMAEGYKVFCYNGQRLPFSDNFFDIVGSFTVLEHVHDPKSFIKEQIRVVRKGGYIIIACPNFLSFFNHVRSYSIFYKCKTLLKKFIGEPKLVSMDPIIRPNGSFLPDDDAIWETNLTSILRLLKNENLKIIEVSGVMRKNNWPVDFIARWPFFRLFLPSCYIICQKSNYQDS